MTLDRRVLALWSDRAYLPDEQVHVTILSPFWGRPARAFAWPEYADALIAHGSEFLSFAELEDADLAVFPFPGRALREPAYLPFAGKFMDAARAAGKPAAFFFDNADTRGHVSPPFPFPDAFVFRGSLFRARRGPREFALPGFHDDVVKSVGGTPPVRRKGAPVVSFCGTVIREEPRATGIRARAKRLLGGARRFAWRLQHRHEEDLFARARALDALRAQDDVRTSILERPGGGGGNWPAFDESRWQSVRSEFLENMLDSDYVLSVRGDGNWSVRLYEALCMGRIPVIVDTDLVMPYDWLLPWRDYGVWIGRSEVDEIGARVAEFHERLSGNEFAELQHACRRLWEDFLSPLGFFRNFHRHFDEHVINAAA